MVVLPVTNLHPDWVKLRWVALEVVTLGEFDLKLCTADWLGFRQRKQQYSKDVKARLQVLKSAPSKQPEQLDQGLRQCW